MTVFYIDATNQEKFIPDSRRRIKDTYYSIDPDFEDYYVDENLSPYSVDDCVLVRVTNQFPLNHEIHTPAADNAYSLDNSIYLGKYIEQYIREQDQNDYNLEQFQIYCKNPRNTLHFTINGLVQSHMYGDFSGRDYIIIEPLKYHVDDSLQSLRPEDTFFEGNMNLSNESSIVISEEIYNIIKNNPEYVKDLEEFNIFVYNGENQILALKQSLNAMGYDHFMLGNNYYVHNGEDYPACQMTSFLQQFAETHSISTAPHNYSSNYSSEIESKLESMKESSKKHLYYILDNCQLPEEFKQTIIHESDYPDSIDFSVLATKLIDTIGIETVLQLTKQFNETIMNNKEEIINLKH